MRLYIWGILIMLILPVTSQAEYNVLISGQFKNPGLVKSIDVTVNEKYLSGELTVYTVDLKPDGSFVLAARLQEPQYVSVNFSQKRGLVFLAPGDTLNIKADAKLFPEGMTFSGKAAKNNEYLLRYFQQCPQELNQFKLKSYRSGNFWYSNTQEMDDWMMKMDPKAIRKKFDIRKEEALKNFDFYVENHPGILTKEFIDFLNTEIIYDWAYHLMLYGNVFKNKYGVTEDFFDFLFETPIDIPTIGSYWYRQFVLAQLEKMYQDNGAAGIEYLEKYRMATEILTDKAKCFVQSEMISLGFGSDEPLSMIDSYFSFIDENPYPAFSDKAAVNYEAALKFASGAPAPDFNLTDISGAQVALNDLKGSVIYLNFWASWCKPCISKMERIKAIQPQLEREGVKFVNISLDKTMATWTNMINSHSFNNGINLFANSEIDAGVASDYEVRILPEYYILDRNGYFAKKPKSNEMTALQATLSQLSQQQ